MSRATDIINEAKVQKFDPKTFSYDDYLKHWTKLDKLVADAGTSLNKFPKGTMGMTPVDVKNSKEFKLAKRDFDMAFKAMQDFNRKTPKSYMKQKSKERLKV